MKIDSARPDEAGLLTDIWEAAVRATHSFLSQADIEHYRPLVREALSRTNTLVARDDSGCPLGFMGLVAPTAAGPAQIPMLFIDPGQHGRGLGRALVELAAERYGLLELEVNEQNPGARIFYEKLGFKVVGRLEVDSEGRPYPFSNCAGRPRSNKSGKNQEGGPAASKRVSMASTACRQLAKRISMSSSPAPSRCRPAPTRTRQFSLAAASRARFLARRSSLWPVTQITLAEAENPSPFRLGRGSARAAAPM